MGATWTLRAARVRRRAEAHLFVCTSCLALAPYRVLQANAFVYTSTVGLMPPLHELPPLHTVSSHDSTCAVTDDVFGCRPCSGVHRPAGLLSAGPQDPPRSMKGVDRTAQSRGRGVASSLHRASWNLAHTRAILIMWMKLAIGGAPLQRANLCAILPCFQAGTAVNMGACC
eukprot:9467673-Pyramimonas_sp.AAC.3